MALPGKATIFNITLASAGVEQTQVLPELTSKIMVRCRQQTDLKLAYNPGDSGTLYITIPAGQTYWDDLVGTSATLCLQAGTNSTIVEILCWSGA